MNFTFFLSAFILVHQLLKLIYLLFEPKFMGKERFGPPKSKMMIAAYYIVAIFMLTLFLLDSLDVIVFIGK